MASTQPSLNEARGLSPLHKRKRPDRLDREFAR